MVVTVGLALNITVVWKFVNYRSVLLSCLRFTHLYFLFYTNNMSLLRYFPFDVLLSIFLRSSTDYLNKNNRN